MDSDAPHGLRLVLDDYPYAVDGLEIWSAIETWVEDYFSFYYKTDEMVEKDSELQSWWKELREVGHGDKKDKPWWPKMHTVKELIDMHHYHLGGFCSPCCSEFRAVPLCRLPSKPPNHKP